MITLEEAMQMLKQKPTTLTKECEIGKELEKDLNKELDKDVNLKKELIKEKAKTHKKPAWHKANALGKVVFVRKGDIVGEKTEDITKEKVEEIKKVEEKQQEEKKRNERETGEEFLVIKPEEENSKLEKVEKVEKPTKKKTMKHKNNEKNTNSNTTKKNTNIGNVVEKREKELLVNEVDIVSLKDRIPADNDGTFHIQVSPYFMNNREKFVDFIRHTFEKYAEKSNQVITCDNIGNQNQDFALLTHQLVAREYMNYYTPYRGLLILHSLGSGKTCTSIALTQALTESFRSNTKIYIMLPASLQSNFREELKKCGHALYKRNQYWEWVPNTHPHLQHMLELMNIPDSFVKKNKGVWLVDIEKPSNFDALSDTEKSLLNVQLDLMIEQKYTFINYNGLHTAALNKLTSNASTNLFDNSVVVIDEVHNLISRIVNKLESDASKKKARKNQKDGKFGNNIYGVDNQPDLTNIPLRLYYMLMNAKNARIVALSGTPIINYPNEFAILFNILRGFIKTWTIPITSESTQPLNLETFQTILKEETTNDYLEYLPSAKHIVITRNPFGFFNQYQQNYSQYKGVEKTAHAEFVDDDQFIKNIVQLLKKNKINVQPSRIQVTNYKALPDTLEAFKMKYLDSNMNLINTQILKRRILGLTSYFRSTQENLLPDYDPSNNFHVLQIPMSSYQFKLYAEARKTERSISKKKKEDIYNAEISTSSYRIFSRLFCNYVIPERPIPKNFKGLEQGDELDEDTNVERENVLNVEGEKDVEGEKEGEKESDVEEIQSYSEKLTETLQHMFENKAEFFELSKLEKYSPKFLAIYNNVHNPDNVGLHLIYSQFRTAEGILLLSYVFEANGYAKFAIKKVNGQWNLDIAPENMHKPKYAFYSGTETTEEKELLRNIYNSDWEKVPAHILDSLSNSNNKNKYGEVIKILMITSSGAEGINLKNTRFVHIVEPYWHPVRTEQVIGRARRICSHKDLKKEEQNVNVFLYLMEFTPAQLKTEEGKQIKKADLGKTSDQYLYEISVTKEKISTKLKDIMIASSMDCFFHGNNKCLNFSHPGNKYTYVPDYNAQLQTDAMENLNKENIFVRGLQKITVDGKDYMGKMMEANQEYLLYDMSSYENAKINPENGLYPVGRLVKNKKGVFVIQPI